MSKDNLKTLHMVTVVLVWVGALNWGLVGFLGFNMVDMLFGAGSMLARLVYMLVGVSAVLELAMHQKMCLACSGKMK